MKLVNNLAKLFSLALASGSICLSQGYAQTLYRNTLPLYVKGTSSLYISSHFINETGSVYQNDATVIIKGDIINRQTTAMTGTGTTNITGSSAQQLLGNQTFYTSNLVLNNTSAGSANFIFNGTNDFTVGVQGTFTDGIVVTNSRKIAFQNSATYSGASDLSHVNGYVEKTGDQAFTFPVGDGTLLRPAGINAPASGTDVFLAKYFYSNANPSYSVTLKDPVLDIISTCEYWTIDRTAGTSNVPVTLSWQTPNSSCIALNPADLYVAGWSNTLSMWKSHGNGGTTGNSTAGTVITSIAPIAYGPFTLAVKNIPLPVTLDYFNGKVTSQGNMLYWRTFSEKDTKKYEVVKSCNGKDWKSIGTVSASKDGNKAQDYTLADLEPCEGLNYYKLVEYSLKDVREEYAVVSLFNDKILKADFQIYPNPNNGSFSVIITGDDLLRYEMEMTDMLGQVVSRHLLVTGLNTVECSDLASGVYLSQFSLGKNKITKKIIIN